MSESKMLQKVHLTRTKRLRTGHLWVFSNELHESPRNYAPGSLVEVYDMHDEFIGIGYISPHSLIAVRLLTRERKGIDREFIRQRINAAIALRQRLIGEREAYRIVYSEGDYQPGLIADTYGTCVVLQFLTYGMEAMKDMVIELFDEIINPEIIVLRNESRVRTLEGLPRHKVIVKGSLENLPVIREDGLLFEIDPYEGQKTGFSSLGRTRDTQARSRKDGWRPAGHRTRATPRPRIGGRISRACPEARDSQRRNDAGRGNAEEGPLPCRGLP